MDMFYSKIESGIISRIVRAYWAPTLMGILAFIPVTGGLIINPVNTDRVLRGGLAPQQLGWEYFRHAPLFQWPIGANRSFGMEMGSSIVYTDSITLFAFIFKPFSPFLPDKFQYIGLWLFICFILQSIFAWKLIGYFTKDKIMMFLGSAFFALTPIYIWRMQGHYALSGHWVILAAIYLYLSQKTSIVRWIVLLVLAPLIHPYFIPMLVLILLADLVQRLWRKEISITKSIVFFLTAGVSILFAMWVAGYFMVSGGVVTTEASVFRMNLLSIFDPNGYSMLLKDQPQGTCDSYETFLYLGIGVLALSLIALYEFFRNPKIERDYKCILPLVLISVVLCVWAVSSPVTIGDKQLFNYEWPAIINIVVRIFRSAGRLFWPVYYLIYLAIIGLVAARIPGNRAKIIVVLFLFFQIFDSLSFYKDTRNVLSFASPGYSPIHSKVWQEFANKYRKLLVAPPRNYTKNGLELAAFAAANKMSVNFSHHARSDASRENEAATNLTRSIIQGQFDADSLYVFNDEKLWEFVRRNHSPEDGVGVLDGFKIYAPKFGRFIKSDFPEKKEEANNPFYQMGKIDFTKAIGYPVYGISTPGSSGAWSDGDKAGIILTLPHLPESDLELLMEAYPFVKENHKVQNVEVLVNGRLLETLMFTEQKAGFRSIKIPRNIAIAKNTTIQVQFNFKNAKSPAELGLSGDMRKLGLIFVWLQLRTK